ncbi:MAG TPA: hypothetical protein VNH42_05850 [Mariprofundaceae bacterium]|nr:hypothetical protein [Mariprofundaceae bacterium]
MMGRVWIGVFLMAVFAGIPNLRADEQADLTKQLNDLKAQYQSLEADRAHLAQRKSDLKWTAQQLTPKISQYKADRANLDSRMAQQKARVDSHNSRCSGSFTDGNYVNQCNEEASQMNAESASLNNENDSLNQTLDLLKKAVQTQQEQEKLVYDQDKKDYDEQVRIYNLETKILTRLKQIAGQNDSCKEAIAAVDANPNNEAAKERMHAVCGAMFDGNRP